LLLLAVGLAIFLMLPRLGILPVSTVDVTQGAILWDARYLDILLQIAIFFSGVLGVLGLLSSGKPKGEKEE